MKVGLSAVLAIGSGVWQSLTKTATWPELIAIGLVTFVCCYWIAEHFIRLPRRWQVREWLDELQFDVKAVPAEGYVFAYVLTDNIGIRTLIDQKNAHDPINISVNGLGPTTHQLDLFKKWPQTWQDNWWRSVRLELLRFGIAFSDLTLEGNGISVSRRLAPTSAMTGLDLSSEIMRVRVAARLYMEYISSISQVALPPPQPPTHDPSGQPPSQA
jgi:hypothetical protein